jgi:protein phosphatase
MGAVLTRAMGVRPEVDPEIMHVNILPGDLFLLTSDGLTDMVEESVIQAILVMERSLEQKAADLIDLALAGGGRDNATLVLAAASPRRGLKQFFNKITKQN